MRLIENSVALFEFFEPGEDRLSCCSDRSAHTRVFRLALKARKENSSDPSNMLGLT